MGVSNLDGDALKELIKMAPYGGFALLMMWIMSSTHNKSMKILKDTSDKAIGEVRTAYKESTEDYRQFIAMITENFINTSKKKEAS